MTVSVLEKKKKPAEQKVFEAGQFEIAINQDGGIEVTDKKSGAKILVTSFTRGYMTVSVPEGQEASQKGPTTGVVMPNRLFIRPHPDKK